MSHLTSSAGLLATFGQASSPGFDDGRSAGAGAVAFFLVVFYLAFIAVMVWAYVRIIQKAGYSGWYVLLGLVPVVNVVMFFVFAFAEWPTTRELKAARSQLAYAGTAQLSSNRFGTPPPVS
jgi:drug/metabolite transporter (DMT)-like permease